MLGLKKQIVSIFPVHVLIPFSRWIVDAFEKIDENGAY